MSNITNKLFVDKMGGRQATDYVGNLGEVFYDPEDSILRISDGFTPGGIPLGGSGGAANLGKFKIENNYIGTVNIPNTGGWGGYDMHLDPNGESNSGIYIPGLEQQQTGGNLQIYNNDNSGGRVQIMTNGGMILSSVRGTLALGTDMEVPGVPQHFHIAFENSNIIPPSNDLFLGDDYNAVQIHGTDGAPYYGVRIKANDRNGGTQQEWRFQTDGNLILPNTAYIDSGIPTVKTTQDFSIGVGDPQIVWNFDQLGTLTLPVGAGNVSNIKSGIIPQVGNTATAGEPTYSYGGTLAVFAPEDFSIGNLEWVQVGWTVTDNQGFTDTIFSIGTPMYGSITTTNGNWPTDGGRTYVFTSPDYVQQTICDLGISTGDTQILLHDDETYGYITMSAHGHQPPNVNSYTDLTLNNIAAAMGMAYEEFIPGNPRFASTGIVARMESADNPVVEITAKSRLAPEGNGNSYTWYFESNGKLQLPTNGTISYDPATPSDWNGSPPTTMQAAIDRLAAAIKAINSTGA